MDIKQLRDPDGNLIVEKFKYVNPTGRIVYTPVGGIALPRGLLSDGATKVPDLSEEGFFYHDKGYILPVTVDNKRMSKWQLDFAYGYLLFKNSKKHKGLKRAYMQFAAIARPFGLQYFSPTAKISRKIWDEYREVEYRMGYEYSDYIHDRHILPRAQCWDIPTTDINDVTWRGL